MLKQVINELEVSQKTVTSRSAELETTLQNLQTMQAQMLQTEKMSALGQMVAGVAHEINNPVNFIYANIHYLQEYSQNILQLIKLYNCHYPNPANEILDFENDIDLEFMQEDLTKIVSSTKVGSERIRAIVLSLRIFSRLDEAEFKTVDIHQGIESAILLLQHRLKPNSNRLQILLVRDYGVLPNVKCYAGELNQVFINLLANAIDALEEVDKNILKITIRTSLVDANWIEIAIADNGVGIPESVKTKVFNPFFTTKPVGKGTGMGLAISYQIVCEKHGGKLDCFSSIGEGTEFKIQIPIQQLSQNSV